MSASRVPVRPAQAVIPKGVQDKIVEMLLDNPSLTVNDICKRRLLGPDTPTRAQILRVWQGDFELRKIIALARQAQSESYIAKTERQVDNALRRAKDDKSADPSRAELKLLDMKMRHGARRLEAETEYHVDLEDRQMKREMLDANIKEAKRARTAHQINVSRPEAITAEVVRNEPLSEEDKDKAH